MEEKESTEFPKFLELGAAGLFFQVFDHPLLVHLLRNYSARNSSSSKANRSL